VNKDLYNSASGVVEFPKEMREHMTICFRKANCQDESLEGFKRNKELQSQKTIDYKQLKRIKNFFDNFQGKQEDLPFILNGEFKMKTWVDNQLRRMREGIHQTKQNKMDTGMENQFMDPHQKDKLVDVRKSKEHKNTLAKYDVEVTESLRRINQLISKI
jgi:hypothetical protein